MPEGLSLRYVNECLIFVSISRGLSASSSSSSYHQYDPLHLLIHFLLRSHISPHHPYQFSSFTSSSFPSFHLLFILPLLTIFIIYPLLFFFPVYTFPSVFLFLSSSS